MYDNVSKDWLYLRGSSDGEVYAYRSSTKEWEVFEVSEPTWEQKYEEWIQNPEPYGGVDVLQQIKDAKDSGATSISFYDNNISDLSPLVWLTSLLSLSLEQNNISDLTPLGGLTNLGYLSLSGNNISDITPLLWAYEFDGALSTCKQHLRHNPTCRAYEFDGALSTWKQHFRHNPAWSWADEFNGALPWR